MRLIYQENPNLQFFFTVGVHLTYIQTNRNGKFRRNLQDYEHLSTSSPLIPSNAV